MSKRLNQLQAILEESPKDPFIIYALAKEYEKLNRFDESVKLFQELLEEHPDYVGTYYHYGGVLERLERFTEAAQVYTRGLEVAQKLNDQLAYRELFGALSKFEDVD